MIPTAMQHRRSPEMMDEAENARRAGCVRNAKTLVTAQGADPSPKQQSGPVSLRRSLQLDNWQVLASGSVAHFEIDLDPGPITNARLRRSTWRTLWPAASRFEAWSEASGIEIVVDLIRRSTVERLARTIAVVPGREQRQLSSEPLSTVGDQKLPGTLVLDRSHQPLDESFL